MSPSEPQSQPLSSDESRESTPLVVIAGGSGFIGQACKRGFLSAGYKVVVLTRNPKANNPDEIHWDGRTPGAWQQAVRDAVAVINLAGKPIATKFTDQALNEIESSRVDATSAIGNAILSGDTRPLWINASATGIYGDRGTEELSEKSVAAKDRVSQICVRWETAVFEHPVDAPKCVIRFGIVLGKNEGALKPLANLTKLGIGGAAGSGRQFISWVHVEDVVDLLLWVVREHKTGIYNATSPNPSTNADFMATLRNVCKRPWSPPAPAFLLKIIGRIIGPDASLMLSSCNAVPKRALDEGFEFRYPELKGALENLLK